LAILNLDKLSDAHTLKSFAGAYDLFGNPVFREGGLLAESVYRFKGQSAPVLIFTEIDFEEMTETVLRKLFVGMTRARLKLVLVMSHWASAAIAGSGEGAIFALMNSVPVATRGSFRLSNRRPTG
jgi:hypothetical protein